VKKQSSHRRNFFKTCLSAATAVMANPNLLAQTDVQYRAYASALLIDHNDQPITSTSFKNNDYFIFHYPYITTPCFLINLKTSISQPLELKTEDNQSYRWSGGVGPENSVVAFSAICAHKMSYPTRSTSFINYHQEEVTFIDNRNKSVKRNQLIYCCSERSVYDPAKGAAVLGGPATQPLTAIIIKYDPIANNYYATGTLGGEQYNRFFENFGFRIALENKIDDIQQLVSESTVAYPADRYTDYQIRC
jgi:arsenite oxidase small subunit